ncbi:hypothetical protein [Nocardia sp. NPDC004711]
MTKRKEPLWRRHARRALGAAIDHDAHAMRLGLREVLRVGSHVVVIEAAGLWIDEMFAVTPPPAGGFSLPEPLPAELSFLGEADLWAMRLVVARADNDLEAARVLFAQAGDWDGLLEWLGHLLALVAMKLESPLESRL